MSSVARFLREKYYREGDGDFFREPPGLTLLHKQHELPLLAEKEEPDRSTENMTNANSMGAAHRQQHRGE